jgi:thiamine biosynthesis lipoprotein
MQVDVRQPTVANKVAEAAIAEVTRIEQRYSRVRPHSFLTEINQTAARGGMLKVEFDISLTKSIRLE